MDNLSNIQGTIYGDRKMSVFLFRPCCWQTILLLFVTWMPKVILCYVMAFFTQLRTGPPARHPTLCHHVRTDATRPRGQSCLLQSHHICRLVPRPEISSCRTLSHTWPSLTTSFLRPTNSDVFTKRTTRDLHWKREAAGHWDKNTLL